MHMTKQQWVSHVKTHAKLSMHGKVVPTFSVIANSDGYPMLHCSTQEGHKWNGILSILRHLRDRHQIAPHLQKIITLVQTHYHEPYKTRAVKDARKWLSCEKRELKYLSKNPNLVVPGAPIKKIRVKIKRPMPLKDTHDVKK